MINNGRYFDKWKDVWWFHFGYIWTRNHFSYNELMFDAFLD